MNNGYVIQWKSKINGRAGRGTRIFSRHEAERLVQELNQEYPQIEHEAISVRDLPEPSVEPTAETPSEIPAPLRSRSAPSRDGGSGPSDDETRHAFSE